MKKLFLLIYLLSTSLAICPLCVVAIGAGVGILKSYGIDDLVSGIWYGALILSTYFSIIDYLEKKNIRFLFRKLLVFILTYLVFVAPIYLFEDIKLNLSTQKIFGMDRIVLGVILGSIILFLAKITDQKLREKNNGKGYFPFQKVIIPILYLIISSIIFNAI
jgi:hypothetical protein